MRSTDEAKKEIRKIVKKLKGDLDQEQYFSKSRSIMEQIEALPEFVQSGTIMMYWSIPGEVFTHTSIQNWASAKRIILPSVDGETMNLKEYTGEKNLISGDLYQIPEPDGALFTDYNSIELIIVPGIAFDRQNNRMGRGKAYYDRFLQTLSTVKVGICFDFQIFNHIPVDEHDVAMDKIISA